jgi:hypothetical protein
VLVVTFLAILGGACCGSLAFASMTSHDTIIHYKMLDGNTTTIDVDVTNEKNTKQCHTSTSDRIINTTTVSSTKNTLKLSTSDIAIADVFFEQTLFTGDDLYISSAPPPPLSDILFSVIKKE